MNPVAALAGNILDELSQSSTPSVTKGRDTFDLPATDIPDEVKATLTPWVAGFIGLTPAQANGRLQERWTDIIAPSLLKLRDVLLEFDVRSVVSFESGRIYAVREGYSEEDFGIGDLWYLSDPLDRALLRSRLEPFSLAGNDLLVEFLHHFGGLSEDTTTCGHFRCQEDPLPAFNDSWDGSIEGFAEWENSLMLYNARNGDQILLRKDGHVAWWYMGAHSVREYAASFEEFIVKFTEHRRHSWPFDGSGIPEHQLRQHPTSIPA